MTKPKLKTVRFEAGGKLVQFKTKMPKIKPAATALIPVIAPKTFKVGIHARTGSPALKSAASAPGQKKFVLVPRATRIGHDVLTPGTKGDSRLRRVVVKGAPRQISLGVPRGKVAVPKHGRSLGPI
jgi:hypothetical protein